MARMPRNQLLDQLFSLFRDPPRWGIRTLRERTQQPEAYLKEVLSEVAFLHRSGEYNGLWELKDNFKGDGVSIVSILLSRRETYARHLDERRGCCGPKRYRIRRR